MSGQRAAPASCAQGFSWAEIKIVMSEEIEKLSESFQFSYSLMRFNCSNKNEESC